MAPFNSNKKVAIITGGASGIGRALCLELAQEQTYIIVADLNEENGEKVVTEICQNGGNAHFERLDVSSKREMEDLVSRIYRKFGRLDYMFNNAGIAMYGELYDMTLEHWEKIININLWGVIHGTQIAYQIMKEQRFGSIVNTASATGLGPAPLSAPYATTKHAVVGLTTSLHYEAKSFGVNVSTLCPAFVNTPIFESAEAINMDRSMINNNVNLQKTMTPEQFAKLALKGVKKNKPIICPMPFRRTMDIFFTLFPFVHDKLMQFICTVSRKAKLPDESLSLNEKQGIN